MIYRSGALLFALTLTLVAPTTVGREDAPLKGAITLNNPILFVTQIPIPADFATIGSTFANHEGDASRVGRGGDLYIRYGDGTLRNLTREAGFGTANVLQGANAIAVRDPAVHWNGTRAVFSMVVGAPDQFDYTEFYWQLYEVTGFGQGQTVSITKVPHQPIDNNNVQPTYASDGRILFVSDRTRNGARHLYPQHDEYESTPTPTGLWSLNKNTGELHILNHTPSGAFTPIVDSFGRLLFTRWDHLQRDQQADADALGGSFGTFNYVDESEGSAMLPRQEEVFPEPRSERDDLLAGTNLLGHRFNNFFPWEMRQDGSVEETLNHIGRHELVNYFTEVFDDDPNLEEFIVSGDVRIENFFQMVEDPNSAGIYYGVDAPEFTTHASGQILRTTAAAPGVAADTMGFVEITHPETGGYNNDNDPPSPFHSGHYRDPEMLADGTLIASHAAETRAAGNDGTRANPVPRYHFRLRTLAETTGDAFMEADQDLTGGISRTVQYYDPDVLVTYSGDLWEMQPVEVRVRPTPPNLLEPPLQAPEAQAFVNAGVDPNQLRDYLRANDLALIVSRDVTSRDAADVQQPFNLRVAGGTAQTVGAPGTVYDIKYLQLFQADQVRGIGGMADPRPGRRVLAQPMHDPAVDNPPSAGPSGSVTLGDDGSLAAFVPARRAMSWQLTAPDHTPVVRERFWVTFQPGEIRVCASCHGLNSVDQVGGGEPTNEPEALGTLLEHWSGLFDDGFESGDINVWSGSVGN